MLLFPERLKILRKNAKLTQKATAISLDISERIFQSYEYGEITPSATILMKVADFFNVSTDYLCGRTDNPDLNNTTPTKKSSIYVSDEDRELVMTCLSLDTADKSIILGAAKAALSNEKYSQKLTKSPAGL